MAHEQPLSGSADGDLCGLHAAEAADHKCRENNPIIGIARLWVQRTRRF